MKKKSILNIIETCPLLVAIISSALILSVIAIGKMLIDKEFNITWKHPALASILEPQDIMSGDKVRTDSSEKITVAADYIIVDDETETAKDGENDDDKQSMTEATIAAGTSKSPDGKPTAKRPAGTTSYVPRAKCEPRAWYYDDPGVTALTTTWNYNHVEPSYYSDALFIGDSRMSGFSMYSGLDTPDYMTREGASVYNIKKDKYNHSMEDSVSFADGIRKAKYKNIYLEFGINELGMCDATAFAVKYKEMIDEIKAAQPEARIIIFSIMGVSKSQSDSSEVFNMDNINDKNVALSTLANGKDIFYMDINTILLNEEGFIREEDTWDGIHVKAEHYIKWADYMLEHGF